MLLGTYALTAEWVYPASFDSPNPTDTHVSLVQNSAFDNYFLQAQRVRKMIRRDFDRVFLTPSPLSTFSDSRRTPDNGVHVLLHPSAIQTAPRLPDATEESLQSDGLDAYVQDILTVPASLAGLPALSVRAGLSEDGWPVGLSVVGQWGSDAMVLAVGRILERLSTQLGSDMSIH